MEGERCFYEAAAAADFLDRERLEHHDLAVQLSEDFNPLAVALIVISCHVRGSVTERGKG